MVRIKVLSSERAEIWEDQDGFSLLCEAIERQVVADLLAPDGEINVGKALSGLTGTLRMIEIHESNGAVEGRWISPRMCRTVVEYI